jgi:hypothetical protein
MTIDTRVAIHDAVGNPLLDVEASINGVTRITDDSGWLQPPWDLEGGYHEFTGPTNFTLPLTNSPESYAIRIYLCLGTTETPRLRIAVDDFDTGEPLPDVDIRVNGSSVAVTNSLGEAIFNIMPGTHTLELIKNGYITIRLPNFDVTPEMGYVVTSVNASYRLWFNMRLGSGVSTPPTSPSQKPQFSAFIVGLLISSLLLLITNPKRF